MLLLISIAGCSTLSANKTAPKNDANSFEQPGVPKVVQRDVTLREFFSGKKKVEPPVSSVAQGASTNGVTVDVSADSALSQPARSQSKSRSNLPIVADDWSRGQFDGAAKLSSDEFPLRAREKQQPIKITSTTKGYRSPAVSPSLNSNGQSRKKVIEQARFDEADTVALDAQLEADEILDSEVQGKSAHAQDTDASGLQPENESIPPSPAPIHVPLVGDESGGNIEITMRNGKVTLVARNASVQAVLNLLAQQQGLNLIASNDVDSNISITLSNVPFEDALNSIVSIAGCTWTQRRGIIMVSRVGGESRGMPDVQGKIVQVFNLNFVSAADLEHTIKGLLSPIGQIFISQTSPTDKRRTQELVVIEDIPASVSRIAQYIQQVDMPPRQVMIEAHVLQIDLTDNTTHGVNWQYITKIAGSDVALSTVGFANPTASPASFFSVNGSHLDLVVQALKTTSSTKTLANPKVIVANGQEARIQIGSKLGYFVTTTTQTSTLQNVNFLSTGVVLRVTPQISNDNRVLLAVRPEVSTGSISAAGLPQTNTTEAETTVLLDDGGGMLMGGLIKESDTDTQDKVPILGDIWLIGRLFQRRTFARQRSEVVIVLIPRIAPYSPDYQAYEQEKVMQTNVPLFQNGLQQTNRPFEPEIPDAIKNPRRLKVSRLPSVFDHPCETDPKPLNYFFPTECEERFPPGNLRICQPPVAPSAVTPLAAEPFFMPPSPEAGCPQTPYDDE